MDESGIDRAKILGVGITFPAVMSEDGSRLLFAPTLGLREVPVSGLIANIPYPVYVDNDGSASGQAEWFARKSQMDMAYLFLEYGVGGAVLMDGTLYRGKNGRSGEFGHICVEPGGLLCNCGKRGCLEGSKRNSASPRTDSSAAWRTTFPSMKNSSMISSGTWPSPSTISTWRSTAT